MRLLFLHGPPASGKYTIGRAIAARTGWELYHNHLVVDEALRHHAFGTSGFVTARDTAWRAHFTGAAADPERRVIFTFNPESSVPQAFIDWLFGDLVAAGATLHSAGLTLAESALEARLATPQRRQFRKLTDLGLYRRLRDSGDFSRPLIPRTDCWLDSEALAPAEAAAHLDRHFRLGERVGGEGASRA